MEKLGVLVVGSINVDLVVRTSVLPAAGETTTGGTFERHGGGKGANQAVAAARLGGRVALVAAVGEDMEGVRAVDELRSEGVDVARIVHAQNVATGVALIVVDANGENQIAVASGANSVLGAEAVEAALESYELDADGVLLIGFEVGDEAIETAARWAAESGHRIILDPAPARQLTQGLASLAPIIKPNAGEAQQLTDESDLEAAAITLSQLTGSPVIVTLGAEGALIADADAVTSMDAYQVIPIDSTGAGDAFSGALAVGLARGLTLVEAVKRAQGAAAVSTTLQGARTGMPDRETLDRFLAAR